MSEGDSKEGATPYPVLIQNSPDNPVYAKVVNASFPCWLYIAAVFKDAEATFRRYAELPFAPTARMNVTLKFGADEDDRLPGNGGIDVDFRNIHHVTYVVGEHVFWCHGRYLDCLGCGCKKEDTCCVLSANLDWWIRAGWELELETRGKNRLFVFEGMFGPKPTSGHVLAEDGTTRLAPHGERQAAKPTALRTSKRNGRRANNLEPPLHGLVRL